MFCDKCGKKLGEGSAFCDGCGKPIENGQIEYNGGTSVDIDDALNRLLSNITKLRRIMFYIFTGLLVFSGVFGLLLGFAENRTQTILFTIVYMVMAVINATVEMAAKQRTSGPMLLTKYNMIVTFINIGVWFILGLVGDGTIIGFIISLVLLIPDVLILVQVKIVYNLAGQVSPSSIPKAEIKRENPPSVAVNANAPQSSNGYEVGQTVFARFDSSEFYFPGIISVINESQLDIAYLDGDKGTVLIADVLELNQALNTLKLQGNFHYEGWYPGKISKTEPLTMQYDDGDVEQVELKQLRGVL